MEESLMFNTKQRYMTDQEEKDFFKFYELGVEAGATYTNASGEEVKIMRVWNAPGAKIRGTAYGPMQKDGSSNYSTPLSAFNPTNGAYLSVKYTKTGKRDSMTGNEFITWLGTEFKAKEKEPHKPSPAELKAVELEVKKYKRMHFEDDILDEAEKIKEKDQKTSRKRRKKGSDE
jgi:hypothetical protein